MAISSLFKCAGIGLFSMPAFSKRNPPRSIPLKPHRTVYDGQTRSMLETDQKLAGIDSNDKDINKNTDGSVTVWFAPTAPAGRNLGWTRKHLGGNHAGQKLERGLAPLRTA